MFRTVVLRIGVVLVATLACSDRQVEPPLIDGGCLCATNVVTVAVKNSPNNGDGQTGTAGSILRDSLAVRVLTQTGFPVGGVPVHWAAADGGSISPALSYTNNDGVTKASWTLGPGAGIQTATAVADRTPNPVTFTAIAIEPPASLVGSARRER